MARRLPIYLLLDVSGSMTGEPITAVQDGVQKMIVALMSDPMALETVCLSVITFSDFARQVIPLTALGQFNPPILSVECMTNLGSALKFLAECADREVVKNTESVKGDWKPLVFIMTDGRSTDNVNEGLIEFKKREWGVVVACAAGSNADTNELLNITNTVVSLDTADSSTIAAFFQWVTLSASSCSKSLRTPVKGINSLDKQLPPPPPEIKLL